MNNVKNANEYNINSKLLLSFVLTLGSIIAVVLLT